MRKRDPNRQNIKHNSRISTANLFNNKAHQGSVTMVNTPLNLSYSTLAQQVQPVEWSYRHSKHNNAVNSFNVDMICIALFPWAEKLKASLLQMY